MFRFRRRYTLIAMASLLPAASGTAAVPSSAGVATQMSETLFRDIDTFWSQQIASLGGRYRSPKLAYLAQPMHGVCGVQATLTGPFYCPVNETVYLDPLFVQQVAERARDEKMLALGYVIAHEVAHHIQNLIGTTGVVNQARSRSTPELANRILTTMELQADCYAGLWARRAATVGTISLPTDTSKALDPVAAIGRERQLHLAAGQEMLDPLTHGIATQRLKWFRRGSDSGRFDDCDTFSANSNGDL